MSSEAEGRGPGAFDVAQAHAYAAAWDIDTVFPHDHVFVDLLWHHARGAALDLGGGTGRYAAWLLARGLVTSVDVLDKSSPMIEACHRRGVPGLRAHVADIETVELGQAHYDLALARFVLMHVQDLDGTVQRIARSLTVHGILAMVTNVIAGTPTARNTFLAATAGIMPLLLEVNGQTIRVANYVRTHDEYRDAFHRAGLDIVVQETYAPHLVRFEQAPPGIVLSHLVLVGKKPDQPG